MRNHNPGTSANGQPAHSRNWIGLICLLGLTCLLTQSVFAQGSVRAYGLAGAYTAAARGIDAVEWNPANLAIGEGGVSIGLASVAVGLYNNSFSLDRYNEISGATLTEADKNRILADIPADGLRLNADARASVLGFHYGNYAFTIQGIGGGGGNLDKDFFELVLLGNEIGETVSFDDTQGGAYAIGSATLSAGLPVYSGYRSRLSAGVNVRYLYGIYEMHVEEASGSLTTTMTEIQGSANASLVTAAGGSGYGMDLGLALQAPRGWVLGLTVDNLYSHLRWDRDPERRLWSASADTINLMHEDMDEAVVDSDSTYAIDAYSTQLPRRLRLGACNRFGNLIVAMDASQELDHQATNAGKTALAAGVEWRALSFLYPRLGLGVGGTAGSSSAIGLGLRLGPWRLDMAALNRGSLWPNDTKGLGVAVGSSLEF
ncbi:MAG: DUF5723 family protein [bacterium]